MMKKLGIIGSITILAGMMLLWGEASATTDALSKNTGWGAWQALSGGFMARRKQPPAAELPRKLRAQAVKAAPGAQTNTNLNIGPSANKGVWLRVRGEGLVAVVIADAASVMGFPASALRQLAAKGRLSLLNRGNPVSWYYDADDDRILFAAQALDSFYTDENAYYLSRDSRDARPMSIAMAQSSDTVPADNQGMSFVDTIRFEEEPDFMYATWSVRDEPDADYWFWDYLFGGSRDQISVNLELPDPAQEGNVQMNVHLRGFTDTDVPNEHKIHARLQDTNVSQMASFDGFGEIVLSLSFDGSMLKADGSNTLLLTSVHAPDQAPGEWLDAVEVRYLRKPVARDGRLWVHGGSTGMQTVRGFNSDDILVIESPAGDASLRRDAAIEPDGDGGWIVSFQTLAGTDYLVAQADSALQPNIVPDYRDGRRLADLDADYLIIAPRTFSGTAGKLQRYHEQISRRQSGKSKAQIAWLEDIYAEFSDGIEDPHAITRFMDSVLASRWNRQPMQVVLVGKGSLDHKNRMGYGDSFLPVLLDATPWALAASDARLLAGSRAPGFAIGRLPITSDAEGMAYVDKLAGYQASSEETASRAVLVADNPDDAGDFVQNSDLLADRLVFELGMSDVEKLYHPDDPVRDHFIQSSTWESVYVNYDGHGSTTQLGDRREKFMTAGDAAMLNNSSYPIFTALTCAAGDDSQPGMRSLASSLVLNPRGGAIASLAPTGLSLDADAQVLGNAFIEHLFIDGRDIGDAVRGAQQETAGKISYFMSRIYSVIGDPALKVRRK
ncbi:C25 family cysteine peptidase [Thiolapillus brandeum]|uniref:Gingipain domain-containing protein n=1 Tax=Thiolapillus brandeum TaxID=1076588 RepID=A0A7U6GHF2_9GAMM|nr:C25 family cysteine peptidase [Thiolapillus brandeum]BAO43698.1 hypothetical protein TBH_C0761 [Thiolapillus brandeum]